MGALKCIILDWEASVGFDMLTDSHRCISKESQVSLLPEAREIPSLANRKSIFTSS